MWNGGQSFSHTFDTPGEYAYFCIPHELSGTDAHIAVTS
jgi:plastocyanin